MPDTSVNPNTDSTDAMWDTTPRAMAERFGARTKVLLAQGDNPREAARLAASYAFQADPSLRLDPKTSSFAQHLFRLGVELNLEAADRMAVKH